MPSCLRREFGKVVLRDIELDLNVVEIGERDYRTARATFGAAGKLRGDQFALFGGALENRAAYGRADHGGIELRLGIIHLALGGLQHVGRERDQSLPMRGPSLESLKDCASEFSSLLIGVVLGLRVVEILLGDYALREEFAGAVESDLVVGGGGAGFGQVVIGLLNFFRARSVFASATAAPWRSPTRLGPVRTWRGIPRLRGAPEPGLL